MAALAALPGSAQSLRIPVIEQPADDWDTCGLAEVAGLKAGGDGFLAVRAGPGSDFDKIDEVHNGDRLYLFSESGDWYGVLYGVGELDCSPITEPRKAERPGAKSGWVHKNWVRPLAG
ncbi:SH3 domain-containing protein [Roseibium aggregatum]|nr:SH3 domain-containing protein [Roseibium aggregatum]